MTPPVILGGFLSVIAGLLMLANSYTRIPTIPPNPSPEGPVRLAVLVVFDQMRGDFPERWRELYGKEGFARIMKDGVTFTHCHYPYGTTTTGPGHASMLTGTCPDKHGIVNNAWYENGQSVYCAGSTRYEFVPGPSARGATVGNPDRLLAETVADVLKAKHPEAKVFGLSLKDRSAILPCGKRPNGAYWFDGKFVTSTYYDDHVHPWVEKFNNSKVADRWFSKNWTRFRTNINYDDFSGPDDVPGEGKGSKQGRTFPHLMTGGEIAIHKEYYSALANSPYGNEMLLQLAKECVTAEKLGADGTPDLLVVSFSSNDLIGHTWGPDSHEVLDVTLRSDALMAELLRFLDDKVGKGRYLVGVTADHGVCPLPEVNTPYRKGAIAKRVDPKQIQKDVEAHLTAKFMSPKAKAEKDKDTAWIESTSFPWVYLNRKAVAAVEKTPEEVAEAMAVFLRTQPDIARAFTRADLEGKFPADDAVANRVRRSFYPARSGDVYIVLKEWYLPSVATGTGTTHGAPFDYDAHVPLMLYGPGITGGRTDEKTTPQAMAAIFAKWLDVPNPSKAEFPIPAVLNVK